VVAGDPSARERPKRLLVLGAGPAQLGLLEAARERGLEVIALDRDPGAPGFRLADKRALVSVEDEPAVERLALAERVDGVIAPGIDWPVGIAARLAQRLGVAHPISPETAVLATSKMRQRERFAAAGVPQPRSRVCRDLAEAQAAVAELGYPCVLKAPDRQGQKGLALVRVPQELPAAVELALAAARSAVCLVEEAVPGPEVTVVAFSSGGRFVPLVVTDRLVAEPPAFGVALAHVFPSEHEGVEDAVVAARAAAEALGIEEGPTYTQVLLSPDGPRIGELAARLGGGHDAELCRVAVGVDLNGLALAAALGEPVDIPEPLPQVGGAVTRFLVAPEGRLEEVQGLDEAIALEGVVAVRSYRAPGFVFGPLLRGADRAGAVLAVGSSREEALERAGRAAERIRFVTADAEAFV
jgi:biotin carboxylase